MAEFMGWEERCREYVRTRQSKDGGFCFYRSDYIEESNLYDTGYALATLSTLESGAPRRSELESWLAGQKPRLSDGGSLSALWSYVRSIRVLELEQGDEIRAAIERSLATFLLPSGRELAGWDAGNLLRDLHRMAELTVWGPVSLPSSWNDRLTELLDALRGRSGAFPRNRENLIDSWRAFTLARTLRIPIEENPLLDFARKRLTPRNPHAFLSIEGESLEAVRCGLELLVAFSQCVEGKEKESIALQIGACQADSGGFGRRIGAIPTLEDSYHGAKALTLLR